MHDISIAIISKLQASKDNCMTISNLCKNICELRCTIYAYLIAELIKPGYAKFVDTIEERSVVLTELGKQFDVMKALKPYLNNSI